MAHEIGRREGSADEGHPTAFPGFGKTTTTMLEMTKPIHGKGKVMVGDSGFCVREGVIECHKCSVWFQAYVKKRGNWPHGVLEDAIDSYFDDLPLGHCENLLAEHDNVEFCIHCCWDSNMFQRSCRPMACLRCGRTIRGIGKLMGAGRASNIWSPLAATHGQSIGSMM